MTKTLTHEHLKSTPLVDQHEDIREVHEYEVLGNPYERMQYVHLTDELIRRLEGDTEDGPKPDVVIYLDKSARPVSWMVRELWDTLAREPGTDYEDGKIPEKPKTAYINVDSERHYTREDIADLRALFTKDEEDGGETHFDGKNILIVDEEGVSHATSNRALAFVKLAFPEAASVEKFIWLDQGPITNYGGWGQPTVFDTEAWQYADTETGGMDGRPLTQTARWFQRREPGVSYGFEAKRQIDDGRGVIETDAATDEEKERLMKNPRFARSMKWLSARPAQTTAKSRALQQDIRALAADIRDKTMPYWPSNDREDYVERVKIFNGVTPREFTEFRAWMQEVWWGSHEDAPARAEQSLQDVARRTATRKLGSSASALARLQGYL